jgi:hypothetical protein
MNIPRYKPWFGEADANNVMFVSVHGPSIEHFRDISLLSFNLLITSIYFCSW